MDHPHPDRRGHPVDLVTQRGIGEDGQHAGGGCRGHGSTVPPRRGTHQHRYTEMCMDAELWNSGRDTIRKRDSATIEYSAERAGETYPR